MDIDILPELPNSDAQRTELQSHYATLQQEYQSFLIQHKTLASKSDLQHKKLSLQENDNAQMKGLLQNYTAKHQQLNDAYYRIVQEHEACQKVKEQLQELAHQRKALSEENMELNFTCTKLRRELKASENRMPVKPLIRAEEVQVPFAIEATTVSDMGSSDDELTSDDLIPYTWTAGSDNQNQYEIFLAYAVTKECELQGYGLDISWSIEEAIPQITDSLRQAETAFGSDQYHAITVLGMHLINTEPAYLFDCLKVNQTIFIGRNSVLAAFISGSTAGASFSQPHHLVGTIEQAETQALKEESTRQGKRKRLEATRKAADKRRRMAEAEVAPSTPIRSNEQATAAATASTAAEQQTYDLNILSKDFLFSLKWL
jgi:hypothetical protein